MKGFNLYKKKKKKKKNFLHISVPPDSQMLQEQAQRDYTGCIPTREKQSDSGFTWLLGVIIFLSKGLSPSLIWLIIQIGPELDQKRLDLPRELHETLLFWVGCYSEYYGECEGP